MAALTPITLDNNEADIPVGKDEIVEFVVAADEIIVIQNTHPFETVLFQVSDNMDRKWFMLKAGEYTKIEKTMFFRVSPSSNEDVILVTDRV